MGFFRLILPPVFCLVLGMGCTSGVLSRKKPPEPSASIRPVLPGFLGYQFSSATYEVGIPINENRPIWTQGEKGSQYRVSPNLPDGLAMDGTTGAVAGTPTQEMARTSFLVQSKDSRGVWLESRFEFEVVKRGQAGVDMDIGMMMELMQ